MDDYFFGLSGDIQNRQARQQASKASTTAGDALTEVRTLTSQVDRLALACQAMWEIVRDQTNITEQDLAEKISEIDLRDGVADGKMGVQIVKCPQCGRNSNSRRNSCIWCGEAIERAHAFEG
ncbi:MAG: hypothetical protein P1V20_16170 [Verrucomicrobiales bacterium]|nr:hypothetical protein [Verrucomicrobiales bacterium]